MNTRHPSSYLVKVYVIVLLLLVGSTIAAAQNEKRALTLEWIFGPEGRPAGAAPPTEWLDDGSFVMLDNRRPVRERTFEKLNPATGQREPLVDAARALAKLKSVAAVDSEVLPWPIFDGGGRRALF